MTARWDALSSAGARASSQPNPCSAGGAEIQRVLVEVGVGAGCRVNDGMCVVDERSFGSSQRRPRAPSCWLKPTSIGRLVERLLPDRRRRRRAGSSPSRPRACWCSRCTGRRTSTGAPTDPRGRLGRYVCVHRRRRARDAARGPLLVVASRPREGCPDSRGSSRRALGRDPQQTDRPWPPPPRPTVRAAPRSGRPGRAPPRWVGTAHPARSRRPGEPD